MIVDGFYSKRRNYWNTSSSFWDKYRNISYKDSYNTIFIEESNLYETPNKNLVSDKLSKIYNINSKKLSDDEIQFIKELSNFFYYKAMGIKDYESTNAKQDILEHYREFYSDLKDKTIVGYTPLEKALYVFNELREKDPNADITEKLDKGLVSVDDIYEIDDKDIFDAEINELMDINNYSRDRKISILKKISLISRLSSNFYLEQDIIKKETEVSKIQTYIPMSSFSQIPNIDIPQMVLPTFKYKLPEKDLDVKINVDVSQRKQILIIVLDYSGSMNNHQKQDWVVAFMIDRLKHVINGDAEIYFSYFLYDTNFLNFKHIKDKKSALEFFRTFSTQANGGDTNIGDNVSYIERNIKDFGKIGKYKVDFEKDKTPEILVINDGQDTPKSKFNYKTNCLALMQYQEDVKNNCIESGGSYLYIDEKDKITEYSKNNKIEY